MTTHPSKWLRVRASGIEPITSKTTQGRVTMFTTNNKQEAIEIFERDGGFLLDLGEGHYAVCDEAQAVNMGRTREALLALPFFSEIDLLPDLYDFGIATLKGVVESINNSPVQGYEDLTSEWKAASYAIRAQQESGYPIDEDSVEAHLDILVENGAEFEYQEAMRMVMTYSQGE